MQSKQREPLHPYTLFLEVKLFVPSGAVLKLMSMKAFVLNVPSPSAAPPGALLTDSLEAAQ